MDSWMRAGFDGGVIGLIVLGVWCFRTPPRARWGNAAAAAAIALALTAVVVSGGLNHLPLLLAVGAVGAMVGWSVAVRVNMIRIPAIVAFQNGAGGGASFLVAYVGLATAAAGTLPVVGAVVGLLGLVLGAGTLTGSVVAGAKLAERMKQTPTVLGCHDAAILGLVAATGALAVFAGLAVGTPAGRVALAALAVTAASLGVLFTIRIGGADMPVLISLLNATSGLAGAMCGVAVQNRLLIACGATVAASGSILTHVMCRAMNRNLLGVLGISRGVGAVGASLPPQAPTPAPADPAPEAVAAPMDRALAVVQRAASVIIIPGYGMALADAAEEVVRLAEALERMDKQVRFAVHPVAGRMPGHMHVLLAEAGVDYEQLFELDAINGDFRHTDVALVVGACDVVNPAAIQQAGTPISGMPVLAAHEAAGVVVCNLDEKPGYSGVPNPLYERPETIAVFGDAKATVAAILAGLDGADGVGTDATT